MAVETVPTFDSYVRGKGDGLIRLAWLVTRNWDDARDCVQDAFVGVYPRWASLAGSERLDGYVNRSVINASITCARRRQRATPVADPQNLPDAPVGADPAAGVAGADAAWRLCAELPPKQRAAVVLRFYQDLSFAEIGEVLGCPEATARSHVHRALTSLRAQLGEGNNDD
jgi:RNA polymerase sigma-70 factor (sigma-E family)